MRFPRLSREPVDLFARPRSNGLPIALRLVRLGGVTGAVVGPVCGLVVAVRLDATADELPEWILLTAFVASWTVVGVTVGVAVGAVYGCIAGLFAESRRPTADMHPQRHRRHAWDLVGCGVVIVLLTVPEFALIGGFPCAAVLVPIAFGLVLVLAGVNGRTWRARPGGRGFRPKPEPSDGVERA